MKIFNQRQLKAWDQATTEEGQMSELDLIEEAGALLADHIEFNILAGLDVPVRIFCGMGNNGGDGLVVARHLGAYITDIEVYIVSHRNKSSKSFSLLLDALEQHKIPVHWIDRNTVTDFDFEKGTVIIDALLGTGLDRPLEGVMAHLIDRLNALQDVQRISLDYPSGLHPDSILGGRAFKADHTLSVGSIKLTSMFQASEPYIGELSLIPLDLSTTFYEESTTSNSTIELSELMTKELKISTHAHKNSFGHMLFIGGQEGMMGAAVLASEASLRAGCGLVTAHVPRCGLDVMQISLPEVMVSLDRGIKALESIPELSAFVACCIGCGMGKSLPPASLKSLIEKPGLRKVLDADALNLMAEHPQLLDSLDASCILTPHVGEFHRLFGKMDNDQLRLERLREKSVELGCYIILKGHHTIISAPTGHCYFNMTGQVSLATAGSGDILAGYLAGQLARGFETLLACQRAVSFHGFSGDLLFEKFGPRGAIARDFLSTLATIEIQYQNLMADPDFDHEMEDDDILGLGLLENPN